ncbi:MULTISPECIES: nucleobase:cation symporter-2 family protein [Pantoea]|jgi:xanthine permease XanP|uniref:Purine permease n=1 Tax=Pantoea brenneri TaxID=472694 RepID=A0A7Y6TQM7_9GAMM|nr:MULTISPECIES: nucleobase:cation symporter-2 family protein [Pantoea]MBZ6393659.1 purine permease [Pantoea sp.]MBZ6437358.1 purine permease [Pantoea sp.]NUY40388.1 purine permease [Pantoea brenneri]NUY47528.1 purine permease [Pantoea brenneri]NUY57855.1 purine permease [Pantoea brenneri]
MSQSHEQSLLYGLDARIGPVPAFFAALQHLLASVVGIITPPLIIGSVLGLQAYIPYLISMSLLVSGLGTFLQARRFFGVGAGMICLQGTSFAFLGVLLSGGLMVKARGGSPEEIMAMLFGCNLVAALIPILISRCVGPLRKVLTPVVTGTVITLIGISLIKVSITDWAGGHNARDFGAPGNLALGALTLLVIVALNRARNRWTRLVAVVAGIVVGCIAAALTGHLQLKAPDHSAALVLPALFKFGFAFDWTIFLPIALVAVIAVIEAVGDLTANCLISQQPIGGTAFQQRLQGGIMADGVSCLLAAIFSAFPNTTFAQNNGVIQMTGVASRYVGMVLGLMLVLLGLFPAVGSLLQQIPPPVLGGATIVMFGSVVAAGIRVMTQTSLGRREMLIVAVSFGVGLGVEAVPEVLKQLPPLINTLFGHAVTTGGLLAILLNMVLPEEARAVSVVPAKALSGSEEQA